MVEADGTIDWANDAALAMHGVKQAREHIAKSGYAAVSPLKKGDDGISRGTAWKDGHTVKVALDFKGNVSTSE